MVDSGGVPRGTGPLVSLLGYYILMEGSSKNTTLGLREKVFSVVSPLSGATASRIFNGCISALILISVALIIIDTFDVPAEFKYFSLIGQGVITTIFTVEYLLRLWTSDLMRPQLPPGKARLKFVFSLHSAIDLLAILPYWLFIGVPFDPRFLGAFRVLRIMRLLRIGFYSKALAVVGSVLRSSARSLFSTFLLLVLLMLVASILMYNAEFEAQPEVFDNALSGFWWAMQTITTIGYGDIYPVTLLGKAIGIIIALLGIGMIAIPTGIISASFVAYGKRAQQGENSEE